MDIQCISDHCLGCDRITYVVWGATDSPVRVCTTYGYPRSWWRRGGCPFHPSMKPQPSKTTVKRRVGQQKQKKRGW